MQCLDSVTSAVYMDCVAFQYNTILITVWAHFPYTTNKAVLKSSIKINLHRIELDSFCANKNVPSILETWIRPMNNENHTKQNQSQTQVTMREWFMSVNAAPHTRKSRIASDSPVLHTFAASLVCVMSKAFKPLKSSLSFRRWENKIKNPYKRLCLKMIWSINLIHCSRFNDSVQTDIFWTDFF